MSRAATEKLCPLLCPPCALTDCYELLLDKTVNCLFLNTYTVDNNQSQLVTKRHFMIRNQQVAGSIPAGGSRFLSQLAFSLQKSWIQFAGCSESASLARKSH